MDLLMKLAELNELYRDLEAKKKRTHEEMKDVKRKIAKYAAVLKHAQEIESVEEKPLVNAEAK